MKIKLFLVSMFLIGCFGCKVFYLQTFPRTDKTRGHDSLNVHFKMAKEIIPSEEPRFLILSDLHRGFGKNDRFQSQKNAYNKLLKLFFTRSYSLILNGDVNEGWGFQKSNVPIIQQFYDGEGKGLEDKFYESEFIKNKRFYGVYGNHDDFLRGKPIEISIKNGELLKLEYFPALKIKNRDKYIFVTHGCQGHGLHDAGDELAAWGVFVKYNGITMVTVADIIRLLKSSSAMKHGENIDEDDFWQFYMANHLYSMSDLKKVPDKAPINKNPIDFESTDVDDKNKNKITEKELISLLKKARILGKDFSTQEENILSWAKTMPITDIILGHTHKSVIYSKPIKYERDFQNPYFSNYIYDNPVKNYVPLLENKNNSINYHNTGMACNKEIPFLFLRGDKFHFIYMNKDTYEFREIVHENGEEKTVTLSESDLLAKIGPEIINDSKK